jgi:hypothetical protein
MAGEVNFQKRLKDYFGPSFRAVSEKGNFDFMAVFSVQEEREDGTIVGLLWPEPNKNFYLEITDVAERDGEWWLVTPNETWVLRKVDKERSEGFAKALADEGISGD